MNQIAYNEMALRPYDDAMSDQFSMYDKMPFTWNPDFNVERVFRKESGNIIKAYRCKVEEPIEIKHD